jgi:hypothetical protein
MPRSCVGVGGAVPDHDLEIAQAQRDGGQQLRQEVEGGRVPHVNKIGQQLQTTGSARKTCLLHSFKRPAGTGALCSSWHLSAAARGN